MHAHTCSLLTHANRIFSPITHLITTSPPPRTTRTKTHVQPIDSIAAYTPPPLPARFPVGSRSNADAFPAGATRLDRDSALVGFKHEGAGTITT
jgi:hypothetical protein